MLNKPIINITEIAINAQLIVFKLSIGIASILEIIEIGLPTPCWAYNEKSINASSRMQSNGKQISIKWQKQYATKCFGEAIQKCSRLLRDRFRTLSLMLKT